MERISLRLKRKELRERLLPLLRGHVFHVTSQPRAERILASGAILANGNAAFPPTYSCSPASYFAKRGCVSVVDLRNVTDRDLTHSLDAYDFLNPVPHEGHPWFFVLAREAHAHLISGAQWKIDKAWTDHLVPFVESGFPRAIRLDMINQLIRVSVD